MWQDLIDILGKICAVYDDLGKLGERKRDALVSIDMKGLSKILDEEQLAAAKIQRLEKKRGSILLELSKSLKVDVNTKAEEFYRKAPNSALKVKLMNLHWTLTQSVGRAVKLRDNNQILAQSALNAVRFHLNRLGGATINPTYGAKGTEGVTHEKKFDFKA